MNKAGFSDKDYKLADPAILEEAKKQDPLQQLTVFPTSEETNEETSEEITSDIDTSRISVPSEIELPNTTVSEIKKSAIEQNEAFEKT